MGLHVECRTQQGERVPKCFGVPGAMHRIEQVIDRWPGSDRTYFRVRTEEGVQYILRCDERDSAAEWEIHFLDARAEVDECSPAAAAGEKPETKQRC